MGQIFTKHYWDVQGQDFVSTMKGMYNVGKDVIDDAESINDKIFFQPVEWTACKLAGIGCSDSGHSKPKPVAGGGPHGGSGNINYSGYHSIIPRYARFGTSVPPSHIAAISHPKVKQAVAQTRGLQRKGLISLGNIEDDRSVGASLTPPTSNIPKDAST